jgi:S1-C subfamily serine protease
MIAPIAMFAAMLNDSRPTARELLATVTVTGRCVKGCPSGEMTLGAGVIVNRRPDGTLVVLTARHVIEHSIAPSIFVRNGAQPGIDFDWFATERFARRASVIAYASNVDLALVSFLPGREDDYGFASLSADDARSRRISGVVVGAPYGSLWTVSEYTVLERGGGTMLLNCSTCGPGDSGGGVFDANGGLLGILVQQRVDGADDETGVRTTEFQAISLAEVRLFLNATRRQRSRGVPPALESRAWARFDATHGPMH